VSEDTACESVEAIELAFTRVDDDATARRYRYDENEDPSLWDVEGMGKKWWRESGGGRSMTPVVRSSQRQRGFKLKYG
jgi:hypothetical protein